ncbi:MAG: hypothetical protein AAGI03_14535, partial [Pseudomonadota bacterium]
APIEKLGQAEVALAIWPWGYRLRRPDRHHRTIVDEMRSALQTSLDTANARADLLTYGPVLRERKLKDAA